jgi:hypothetical protein
MGKLKEKLLNNLSNQEMDEQFELSAFEYVEYLSKYKEQQDEYIPTDDELEKLESMVAEYYKSKEFREYVENYTATDEYVDSLTDEEIDKAFAEHNAAEEGFDIDAINDSMILKYTDSDVVEAIKSLNNEKWLIDGVMGILNDTWNRKNGLI